MTKAEAYEKAWTLGFRGDFSMVDQIYHPKYRAIQKNINVEVDLDSDKIVVSTISEYNTPGPVRVIFENDDFLLIERYFKSTLTETHSSIQCGDDCSKILRWENYYSGDHWRKRFTRSQ